MLRTAANGYRTRTRDHGCLCWSSTLARRRHSRRLTGCSTRGPRHRVGGDARLGPANPAHRCRTSSLGGWSVRAQHTRALFFPASPPGAEAVQGRAFGPLELRAAPS